MPYDEYRGCPNSRQCGHLIRSLYMTPQHLTLQTHVHSYAMNLRDRIRVENGFLKGLDYNLCYFILKQNKSAKPLNIEDMEKVCSDITGHPHRYVVYGKHNIDDFQFSKYVSEICKKDIRTVVDIVQASGVYEKLNSASATVKEQMGMIYSRIITCVIICELARTLYLMDSLIRIESLDCNDTDRFLNEVLKSHRAQDRIGGLFVMKTKQLTKIAVDQLYPRHQKLYHLLSPQNIKIAQKNPDGDAFFGGMDPKNIDEIRSSHCKIDNYFYLKIFEDVDYSPNPSLVMPVVLESQPQITYIEI